MESKGKLKGVARDLATNKWNLTFEIDGSLPAVDNLISRELRITVKPWKEKRSLNANSYFHVLVGKIAEAIGASSTEVKNQILADFGQLETDDDGNPSKIMILDSVKWDAVEWLHLKPTTIVLTMEGKAYRIYNIIRGTHTYDTAEMSRIIDETVRLAQDVGVETLTPKELEAMKKAWK